MAQPVDVPAEGLEAICDHYWTHKIKGGHPLSVAVCRFCGAIDWKLLAEDFTKAAREYARTVMEGTYGRHDYPDGSRSLCQRGMINIIQVYSLFTKEPGQDGSSLPPRPVSSWCFMPGHHEVSAPAHFADCPPGCDIDHQVTERSKSPVCTDPECAVDHRQTKRPK